MPETKPRRGDIVYLVELAQYLHHGCHLVRRWAKKQGLVRYRHRQTPVREPREYLTARGAMRVIAYFRALQGEQYLHGKDFHERRERDITGKRERQRKVRQKRHGDLKPT